MHIVAMEVKNFHLFTQHPNPAPSWPRASGISYKYVQLPTLTCHLKPPNPNLSNAKDSFFYGKHEYKNELD